MAADGQHADEDGDTLSNAEREAVAEADEWLKHNQPIPHEEVLAGFGLTMADWEGMGSSLRQQKRLTKTAAKSSEMLY